MTSGCGTVQNCCPGGERRVYGGVQTTVANMVEYPECLVAAPLIPVVLALDVVGDTVTLPYILGRQAYWWAWAKTRRPNVPSTPTTIEIPPAPLDEPNH